MEQQIVIEHVNFGYPSANGERNPVLKDINLTIPKGQFVAVLGHNGSGKSTLAKHLNGFLQPQEGRVLVEGIDTKEEGRIYDIRQKVGMVFQNPDNQIVTTVVEEDVAFALENLGIPPEEIRKRIDWAMDIAGITEYKDRAPHQLSGGQKQRVAIAGVVAMVPDYLVLDESTAMLDPKGREEVMNTISFLNKDQGITVVHITHYMEEAALADRIIVMDEGGILLDGTPKEVFSQVKLLRENDLDVPQPTKLMTLLQEKGLPLPSGVTSIEDCVNEIAKVLEGTSCQS